MRKLFAALAALCILCVNQSAVAQKKNITSRVRLFIPQTELRSLRAAGVDFDHGYYDHEKKTYENEFAAEDIEKIKRLGYRYEILIPDVFRYTDSLNRVQDPYAHANDPIPVPKQYRHLRLNFATNGNYEAFAPTPSTFTLGSRGGFYDLTELNAQIDNMVASYPGLVHKYDIGTTLQGRPITVIRISDNAGTDEITEPEVLYTGMHHSREGMSMMNLIFFMRFLLENYATNPSIKALVDSRQLYFIPVVNVDGFNQNTLLTNWNNSVRMRRKNMQNTTTMASNADGSGGDGVDINRNYPRYWGDAYSNGGGASSGTGNNDAYRGPSAGSEIETQRMMTFVNARRFKLALNYHCAGNWWIRPEGPDPGVYSDVAVAASDVAVFNSLGNLFTRYNCYVYGTANQTIYDVNGYSDDWFFSDPSHSKIYAFSPEIGTASPTPSPDGFWCPQARIIPLAKECLFPNIQAAYTAGVYGELQDMSDLVVTATSGSFNYSVTRRGLTDGPLTVTLIPLNNIQTVGAPVTINSIATFGAQSAGGISYTLPTGIASGTPIRFIWRLEADGLTINDTVLKYFNPPVANIVSDNMETGVVTDRWTLTGTGSAWGYQAGAGVGGGRALTESPGGNYGINADQSVQLSTPLNLSGATQAYLSFLVRYNSENCRDRLQVEISTTGVNGTYSPIVTDNSITENRGSLGNVPAITGSSDGWMRELISLRPYIGNTNIGLRFRFRSNGSTVVSYNTDGFQIDNFQVVKSAGVVLPLRFDEITATRQGPAVTVRWKAETDATFASYAVQRSVNGGPFETIALLTDAAANQFLDPAPQTGRNAYRVQIRSTNGRELNSGTAIVVFEPITAVKIYPNPFRGPISVEMVCEKEERISIEIYDAAGRVAMKEAVRFRKGLNVYTLSTTTSLPAYCFIKLTNSAGVVVHSQPLFRAGSR